jgi:DNA polymerase-3 subunit epsilon
MPTHYNLKDKEKAQLWAQDMLRLPDFFVLDTETTGIDQRAETIQIGIINKSGATVLETLVRPTRPVPAAATQVHGITNEMLATAPTFDEIYVRLSAILAAANVIAYNMDFDWRILSQTAAVYRLPIFLNVKKHCAMLNYARFHGSFDLQKRAYRWHKLGTACQQMKIPVANAHSALGDARMTLALVRKMAE